MSIFRGFGAHLSLKKFSVHVCVWLVLPAIAAAQSVDTQNSNEVGLEQAVTLALGHSLELASIRANSDAIRAALQPAAGTAPGAG